MMKKKKILIVLAKAAKGVGGAEVQVLNLLSVLSSGYEFHVTYADGALSTDFVGAGAVICPITVRSKSDFGSLLGLIRYVRANGIDLIHSHQPALDWVSAFVSIFASRPLIITRHSDISWFVHRSLLVRWIFQFFDIFSMLTAKTVIAVSEKGKRALSSLAVLTRTRVVRVYNAASEKYLRAECALSESNSHVVGMVAQMTVDKGHGMLIEVAAKVVSSIPDVTFLLVGDGPERNKIEDDIARRGLIGNFKMVGFQANIYPYYLEMDIHVLTSLREGLPMVLLEAMGMGKPVVATTVGGVPELVRNGENGFLCDYGDSTAMAEKIIALLNSPVMRAQMGQQAKLRVKEDFSLAKMAAAYGAEYVNCFQR